MPGMNGRELSDRLKELRPATKVLFMPGYSENVIVHQGILKPGIAYIARPMAPDALAARVREILEAEETSGAHLVRQLLDNLAEP